MRAEMTELVMPGDANPMGTAFGGRIMAWIDMVAAIAAQRAVGAVVTASVDSIEFEKPVRVGDVVTLKAAVLPGRAVETCQGGCGEDPGHGNAACRAENGGRHKVIQYWREDAMRHRRPDI